MRFVAVLLVSLFLASCASYGKKVDQGQVSQFKKGETTYSEVVATLGKPTHSIMNSDGTKSAIYAYFQSQANAANFIPYVGMFVGGASTESTSVTFNFDEHSILKDYSSSEGSADVGTGIISGQRQ